MRAIVANKILYGIILLYMLQYKYAIILLGGVVMATRLKNVTFSLPVELLERFKEYAKDKYIPSLNAGVKEALEEYATFIEKEKLSKDMMEAVRDPLFMKDLEDSMRLFEFSDEEVAKGMQEW